MVGEIKNCNTLPTIQSPIQNGGGSLNIRVAQVNFEVVLEIQEREVQNLWKCKYATESPT
jgi:hypothetical protein